MILNESLIPSYNRGKQKYMDFVRLMFKPIEDIGTLLDCFDNAFKLDNAVGQQLDFIGSIVGVSRIIPFVPSSGSKELNDKAYRRLIKVEVSKNQIDVTNEGYENFIKSVFPSYNISIEDNQDCTMRAVISGTSGEQLDQIEKEMLNNGLLIPRPSGVSMTYETPIEVAEAILEINSGSYGTIRSTLPGAGL